MSQHKKNKCSRLQDKQNLRMAGKLNPLLILFPSLPSQGGTNLEHHASGTVWERNRSLNTTNIQELGQVCRSFRPPYYQLRRHYSVKPTAQRAMLQNLRSNPFRHAFCMVQAPAEDVFLRSRGKYGIFSAASSASVLPNAATGGSSLSPNRPFAYPPACICWGFVWQAVILSAATTGRRALWTGLAATDFDLFHQEEFGQQNPLTPFSSGRFPLKLTAGKASATHG